MAKPEHASILGRLGARTYLSVSMKDYIDLTRIATKLHLLDFVK